MYQNRPVMHWIHHLSPARVLLFFYLIAIVFSTILLSLPIAYQENLRIAFIDILFVAVSALSVTGLTPISITDTFSTTGIIFISIILHLGAIGVMTLSTMIWLFIGKRIGIAERRLLMQDQNQTSFGGIVSLMKQIIMVFFIVEFVAIIVLGIYFMRYFPTVSEAFFHSYFSTISAMSNGGFALFPDSLNRFSEDYIVQLIFIILIIFGAIGFPVLIEVKEYLFTKRQHKYKFRFSLFTKLTTITFFLFIVFGTAFIFLMDINGFFKGKSWHEGLFYALFQSVTTRSAGLSTMDVSLLTEANQLFLSFLMFVGASPSSAGGGIRTTTFALVLIFLITYARGGKRVKIFHREIHDEDLIKAVTVTIVAGAMIFISLIILTICEPFAMNELFFEVTSAFGTVGLTLGITGELSAFSKCILMVLMFLGRIGLVTFLLTFTQENKYDAIRYPKERIIIG